MLPEGGVRAAFPNTPSCEIRLVEVRWPDGVRCLTCSGSDIGYVEKRSLYQCRTCRRQFSVTAETVAHHSRLDLRMWFIAAEDIITAYAKSNEENWLIGERMAKHYGISYPAMYRLKKILIEELSQQPAGGLIGACVCVRPLPISRDPEVSAQDWHHKLWSAMGN